MLREPDTTVTWMRRIAFVAVLLAFGVVVLGAYVRLTTAGLGCPDWPGCYGHLTPTAAAAGIAAGTTDPGTKPLNVGRAWREMVHRYFAGSLVVLTLILAVLAFHAEAAARRRAMRACRSHSRSSPPSSSRRCSACSPSPGRWHRRS